MFVPRSGWQGEPSLPPAKKKSSSMRHDTSDVGFQESEIRKILDHDETAKEKQWQVEGEGCAKRGGRSREYAYHCSGDEHVPRYAPVEAQGLGDQLESHILFHERNGSLLPHSYTHTSSSSLRSILISPLPPSPRMPSPGTCWPVTEPQADAPTSSGLEMIPMSTGSTASLSIPPNPSESCQSAYGSGVLHNAPLGTYKESRASETGKPAAQVPIRRENLDSKSLEEMGKGRKNEEMKFEVQTFSRSESNQPNSVVDVESSQDSLMSESESDSEGEWLTGRYIPDFLREQWLSGSALEMPTMEARAMDIVRQALVDQVMSAFPIFDPRWATNFTSNAGSPNKRSNSTNTSKSIRNSGSNSSPANNDRKRLFDDEEDVPADGNDGPPDSSRLNHGMPQDLQLGLKLACPFRKHDAEKYNLQHYRVCATKPWNSISRLKQHLKLVHKAPIFCPKCKRTFRTSGALFSHIDVPDEESIRACKHRDVPSPPGMTPVMEEKLKGRWRAPTPQALWVKIYEILFPKEAVPSPDFDQILDSSVVPGPASPTSTFERPSKRELLRLVRARVNNTIDVDIRSLSERVKSKLADIIEDCYVELDLACQNNHEIRQISYPLNDEHQPPLGNIAPQDETQQRAACAAIEESSLHPRMESNVKRTRRFTPLEISYPMAPHTQTSCPDSSPSNCFCMGPCTCLALTSPLFTELDMDFEGSSTYMSNYEALWNGGPTNMALFESYVKETN